MKNRKYPTYEDAKAYIESVGEAKYLGLEFGRKIFTLEIPGRPFYILFLHDDGLIELWRETIKPK